VQLELRLKAAGIPVLQAAAKLAPRLSSLDLALHVSWMTDAIHVDDFAVHFRAVPSLRTLHVLNAYEHLHGGQPPWVPLPASQDALGTSTCVTAFDALQWCMTRVVQYMPALEVLHVTDGGNEGPGRYTTPWTLQASYWVRPKLDGTRELEMMGTPKLGMAAKYLPKRAQADDSVGTRYAGSFVRVP